MFSKFLWDECPENACLDMISAVYASREVRNDFGGAQFRLRFSGLAIDSMRCVW